MEWLFEDYDEPEEMNSTVNFTCENSIDMEHYLHYSLAPAVIIILVLACLEKRSRRWCIDGKLNKLYGRGGVIIPFDFVGAFSNRWSFGFAFGATADKLMFLFDQDFPTIPMPSWTKVFWVMLIATEVGLSSYPFFACLSTCYQKTGAILGLLYTLSWLIVMLIDIVECPHGDSELFPFYTNVIRFLPSLLCQFFLLGRFLHILVQSFRIPDAQATLNEETFPLEVHQIHYVQRLLEKPPLQLPQKSWIQRRLYEWDPYFKFPSRMISTAVVVFICLYMFIILELMIYKLFSTEIPEALDQSLKDLPGWSSAIQEFVHVFQGVWMTTIVVASLTSITYVFHALACYRKHIKWLRCGKKHFFLSDITKISPSFSVVALARYSSWQIAYTVWGYLIMHLVQWVAGMVLMYVIILPMIHGQWAQLLEKWGTAILSFVVVFMVKKLQFLIGGIFFLQPKISSKDKHKLLALDNRKAFQNFTYFLFFCTVVVGLFSCLMRLLRSVILGAWLIGRIDRPVMPKGYETCDMGFKTWVGMLLMDHYHTNPILLCFCHILVTKNRGKSLQRTSYIAMTAPTETGPRVSAKARTRWLLLYTLLNNPSLRTFRKSKSGSHSSQLSDGFQLNFSA